MLCANTRICARVQYTFTVLKNFQSPFRLACKNLVISSKIIFKLRTHIIMPVASTNHSLFLLDSLLLGGFFAIPVVVCGIKSVYRGLPSSTERGENLGFSPSICVKGRRRRRRRRKALDGSLEMKGVRKFAACLPLKPDFSNG